MNSIRGTWVLLSAGLALAWLVEAPSAHASCGHYVKVGGAGHPAMNHETLQPHRTGTDAPVPLHPPCSGPTCSENHQPLNPPPSPPGGTEQDRFGQTCREAVQ